MRSTAPTALARGASIGLKLVGFTVIILALVSALVARVVIGHTRRHILAAKSTAAAMVADLSASALAAPLDFEDPEGLRAELKHLQSNPSILYAVVWASGTAPEAEIGTPLPELATLRGVERPVERALEPRLDVARPISRADGKRLGTLAIAFSLENENAAFRSARDNILWLSVMVSAVTAALLVGFARWQIVRPLMQLVHAARGLGAGDRTVHVQVQSSDELGHLAAVFNSMRAAIVEREERLAAAMHRLRELFDNMAQAIVVFGPDGKLESETSRQATVLFGERASAGQRIDELLYDCVDGVEAKALRTWLPIAFDTPADEWGEVADLAPKAAVLSRHDGQRRNASLVFLPIVEDNAVAKIMLLATDETELRQLETAVRSKDEEHARQIAAMRRLLAGGGEVFVAFISASLERLRRATELATGPRLAPGSADELFHHIHTIKGEARAFDLRALADLASTFEDELARAQAVARSEGGIAMDRYQGWVERLAAMRAALAEAEEVFVSASPVGRAILEQTTVRRADVEELLGLVGARDDAVARVAKRLASRPFGEALTGLAERVPNWASSVDKRARLEIVGKEVLIPAELGRTLSGVLTHLVRNAIAHGIEPVDERRARGKPEVGVITARCELVDGEPEITLCDDGAGIDFEVLRSKAGQKGSANVPEESLPFLAGLSALGAASDLAGHGQGLSAARAMLEPIGWTLSLARVEVGAAFCISRGARGGGAREGD